MKQYKTAIDIGLGDVLIAKAQFDGVKHEYDKIEIAFKPTWKMWRGPDYDKFLNDLGKLFFSDAPYILLPNQDVPGTGAFWRHNNGFPMKKPELEHLLCKGTPLNIGEYIVLPTKIRHFNYEATYKVIATQYFDLIRQLATKYKIVVLGEKVIEMNEENKQLGTNDVYSIYNDIIKNVPGDKLVDLTIPGLGITNPTLSQLQQDCLIMNQAKVVITLGIAGCFAMAMSVANIVGFVVYQVESDILTGQLQPRCKVTKDFEQFKEFVKEYL